MKRLLLMLLLLSSTSAALMAQRTVTGRVTDASNGETLIGATVSVKGSRVGTISDTDGNFKLNASDSDVLVVSYTGYQTLEVSVGNRSTIDLAMTANTILDEVVVVGYGKQIKSTLTGNIAKVDGKSLQSMPVVSFEQALQGQAAGVFVETTNGKVGAANRIRVRGVGSINAGTEPLYVVDGIPLAKDARNTAGGAMNPLSDLNFNDIASIEILKDASAKAIYGSRGSNGVVLITTKSGQSGKAKVELDVQIGASQPTRRREFLNAAEYVEYFTEAANNSDDIDGVAYDDPDSWTSFVTSETSGRLRRYSGANNSWKEKIDRTDWQEEALRQGSIRNTTLSFSGGNDKIRYYTSGYFGNIEGIIIANAMQKNGGRVNLDFNATSRLKVGVNLNVARTFTDQVTDDNAFSTPMQLVAMAPITPTRDENGVLYDRPVTTYYNGLIEVEESKRRVSTLRTLGTIFGDYSFTPHLALRVEGSANLYNVNDAASFGSRTDEGNDSNGAAYSAAAFATDYNTNAVLRWNRDFNKHNLGLNLGTEFFSSENTRQYAFGEQFPTDDFRTLASAASITEATGTVTEYTFLSYFGRAAYNFDRKYLFNVSARMDGSSRFGADNRYAFFPAASAGWVLSEEEFLKNNKTFSFLKLRASWGQSGNADIGNFPALGLFSAGNYNGSSTLRPDQIANPGLTWEKSTESDFGLDFGLFNNRLTGEIDYYVKNTTDLLLNVPVPATSGFSTQTQNIGEIQNKGWEFTLTSNNLTGAFSWTTSFNLAINRNKVLSLADGQNVIDDGGSRYMNVVRVGSPIGVFYGGEYAGVDPANGDALWYINKADDNGNIADPTATTSDFSEVNFVELGSPIPAVIGGISNTFAWKGLSLDVRLQGQYGNKVHNSAGLFMSCNACWFDNQTRDQLNSWKKPGDITNVPEARLGYSNGDQSRSSRYVEDGSYLRVKNVTIAYDLPTSVVKKARMGSVRLYATGTNLLTFTKYTGWDPEVTTDFLASNIVYGVDFYAAPQPKTIVGGIRIGF
jgi:TonB-dependent starch-binding outer membrane protein SusC